MEVLCKTCEQMTSQKSKLDSSDSVYFCDSCGKANWPDDKWPGWARLAGVL